MSDRKEVVKNEDQQLMRKLFECSFWIGIESWLKWAIVPDHATLPAQTEKLNVEGRVQVQENFRDRNLISRLVVCYCPTCGCRHTA